MAGLKGLIFLWCLLFHGNVFSQRLFSEHRDGLDLGIHPDNRNYLREVLSKPEAIESLFEDFAKTYDKDYLNHAEKKRRLQIFESNLKKYAKRNEEEKGTAVYGVDQFSDLTEEEFERKFLTFRPDAFKKSSYEFYDSHELIKPGKKVPKNFDWVTKGVVSPVKHQGTCGSCWAFSTVANLEGLYALKNKKLVTFSEQQLVDCDKVNDGCAGGWMSDAVDYIKNATGLMTSDDYPYAGKNQNCTFDPAKVAVKVKANRMLPRNERKILNYLYKHGPISVAIDGQAMSGYRGGIAHPPESKCLKADKYVNHAITLVGFGVETFVINGEKLRMPYWIAKNSYGTEFGWKGYYYFYRGDNTCGVHNYASSAVLAR